MAVLLDLFHVHTYERAPCVRGVVQGALPHEAGQEVDMVSSQHLWSMPPCSRTKLPLLSISSIHHLLQEAAESIQPHQVVCAVSVREGVQRIIAVHAEGTGRCDADGFVLGQVQAWGLLQIRQPVFGGVLVCLGDGSVAVAVDVHNGASFSGNRPYHAWLPVVSRLSMSAKAFSMRSV